MSHLFTPHSNHNHVIVGIKTPSATNRKKKFLLSLLFFWSFILSTSLLKANADISTAITSNSFPYSSLMMPCPGGPGVIGGHAFQDFNYNGIDDQLGRGLAGIEVNLFTCGISGESESIATAVTDANGDYFFPNLMDGQEYRIEFSIPNAQGYLESGFNATDSRTTVQFINSPNCEVNIGLANPDDYCEEDPRLFVPCYVNGDPLAAGSMSAEEDALVSFNSSDSGTNPKPTTLATAKEIGATWGITYNKSKETIYTSAFLKRHVGLGPLGLGGIYKVDVSGTGGAVTPFLDLNSIGAGVGTYDSNAARGLSADINLPSNDPAAFDDIGKKGLGGLTMSADGNTLYVISLTDKTLYAIDISSGNTPLSGDLTSYPIPDPGCTGGEFRPFAIQIYNEQLYVGGVCDAETSQQKADLRSIIYRLDGTSFTEVLNFSLDFQKGLASRSCDDDRGWFPWSSELAEQCFKSGNANIIVQPTPVLSDIEFDADGNMIIGYTDRMGNQLGYLNYGPVGQTELYSVFTGGDILKAGLNADGTFTIENNGTAAGQTTVGAGNGEGPGGGEFFSFDVFEVAPNIPRPHSETAQGGLALIKGSQQVIGTSLDPFGTFVNSGGVNYWNVETGEVRDPGYVVFRSGSNSIATFSKANGLGDIATLCGAAPIELGGRIWVDANTNGVQDPCESILPNITLTLYDGAGMAIASTTTDDKGEYFFNANNLALGSIAPNANYTVVVGSAEQTQTPLTLLNIYTSTAKDIGIGPNNDLNDSDVQIGDISSLTNAFIIPITTGGLGSVSHSNDAGFFEIPPPPVANITGQAFNDLNQNGLQDSGEPYISGVTVTLFNADGSIVTTTSTDETGSYIFEDILAGDYYIEIDYETNVDGTIVNFDGTIADAGDDTIDSDFDPTTGKTNIISFNPNNGDVDYDAGIFQPEGSITGTAFDDLNGNGLQDANESGIAGVVVHLQDCAGGIINTTLTDGSGNYQFDNLFAGSYQIVIDIATNANNIDNYLTTSQDVGTDDTIDSDITPGTNASECINFNPKENTAIDAGFVQPTGDFVGTTFDDVNGDGIQGVDEPGIGGILVTLMDCNGTTIATTTTDPSGNYSFGDLLKGNYQVAFNTDSNDNNIPNYEVSPQDAGSNDLIDSDINPNTSTSDCQAFDPDQGIAIDAGFTEPKGSFVGSAFIDEDGDGIRGPNEGALPGLTVSLADCQLNIIATTLTDDQGNYTFGEVPLGDYKIIFGIPADDKGTDYSASPKDQGSDETVDSDINPSDNSTDCVAFTPQIGELIDAGFVPPANSISGIAFHDLNVNGIQDPNEEAIEGVTITLSDCNNNIISSTTTDANGLYTFENIRSGDYQISFNPLTNNNGISDYLTAPQNIGTDENADSDINPNTNTSACIEYNTIVNPAIDAGFYRPTGAFIGTTFDDLNGDGVQGVDEPGIGGISVALLDCNGNTIATTTTDPSGNYSFGDILQGNYQVSFNPIGNTNNVPNYIASPQDVGTNDAVDSDINPNTNTSDCQAFDPNTGANIDAGFIEPTGMITGTVFEDVDGDGINDIDEGIIANLPISLLTCTGEVVATTITDAAGNYSFGDIPLGNYQISFALPTDNAGVEYLPTTKDAGTDDTLDSDINANTNSTDCISFDPAIGADIDAGFFPPTATLSGLAFEDANEDGIQDPNEGPIAGVTVNLVDCNGTVIASTTTNTNGNYSFDNLVSASYQVVFNPITNLDGISDYNTSPQNTGTGQQTDSNINPINNTSECISFIANQNTTVDAGFFQPTGAFVGTVFEDLNEDGLQDANEPGIGGVLVTLMDCSGNTVATTTTDASGNYTFGDLLSGDYQVVFNTSNNSNNVDNYTTSPQDIGTNEQIDSDINPTTNTSACITFSPELGADIDAGFIEPTGTLTGLAFEDSDGDGIRGTDEPLLSNLEVNLADCAGNIIATTTTDVNGNYSFGDLKEGDYQVIFGKPTDTQGLDYLTTPQDVGGNEDVDSDVDPSSNSSGCISFTVDGATKIDAGFFPPTGPIKGFAFDDLNQNGIQDPNEGGIGGITVNLMDCNGNNIATTTTDNAGNYSFGDLRSGNYQISFNSATNNNNIRDYQTSPQNIGTDDKLNSDINTITNASDCIMFSPDTGAEIDAGFFQPTGSLSGTAFEDANADGTQDFDEAILSGVTVNLIKCNGTIVATTTTDSNGNYSFMDLKADNYQVVFDISTNDNNITDYLTAPQGVNSAINPTTNTSACIGFDPAQGAIIDAGFYRPTGPVEGTVFNDLDGDGMQEAGEIGIEGMTVNLLNCNGTIIASTVTDFNGNYSFDGLNTGNYQVAFIATTNIYNITDYLTSPPNRGDDTMDSDINATTNTSDCIAFNPLSGADIDAGFLQPKGEIVGTIFNDKNEDGMQGAGEVGIPGVTVILLDDTGNPIANTVTNDNGNYSFTDLITGNYQILIDQNTNTNNVNNYILTSQDMGDDEFDSDINPADNRSDIFAFTPADGADIDGGLFQPANPVTIGNMVFKDCNKNGVFETGEVGIEGIIIMLSGMDDLGAAVNLQATTNANGNYQFNIPRPGNFQLMFIVPSELSGIEFSPQNVGSNDSMDSDADPSTGIVASFTVNSGETIDHIDVGLVDIAAPLIFNVPPDMTVSCNDVPDVPVSVKGVDNCDPDVVVNFTEQINTAGCNGTIVRTWTTTDDCGNSAEKQQTITITDEEAPIITLSNPLLVGIPNGGEVTFDCDNMPEFDENDIIVSDNCDEDVAIEFVDLVRTEGNCEVDGFIVQMTCGWKATDDCGNVSEYVIVITVVDNKAPMLANIPDDISINIDAGQFIPEASTAVTATDNCDDNVSISFEQTQTEGGPCGYDILRTWTATDNCGNKVAETQTISILKDCTCPEFLTDGMMTLGAACDGSTGGMVRLNLTADARHYEFDFVPNLGEPNFLGNVRNNLPAGDYTITVTYKGAEDCTETLNINIGTMGSMPVQVAESKKADCYMPNGFVVLAPASFIYEWSDGIIAHQRSDLAAGTYKVNYTDEQGCKGQTTVVVEEPANCACLNFKLAIVSNTSPSCPGAADARIEVNTQGGEDMVRYEWSDGTMGKVIGNIASGMYSITATDANGCQVQQEIMVMAPESLTATISQTNGACGEKGTIDLFVRGGIAPYTYNWDNGATTEDLLSLESGVYQVTIQDANLCEITASAMINNGGDLSIQLANRLPKCTGSADGSVLATIVGGTAPYTYLWSNGATTRDLTNITSGDYSLVVTDAIGCKSVAQIQVADPAELDLVLSPILPGCVGGTGGIDLSVTGGTAPYTYAWDTGASLQNLNGLTSGNYSVVVTDANGCVAVGVTSLDIPSPLTLTSTIQQPACAGDVGAIALTVAGGVGPFTYQWDFGSTEKNINNLAPGTYIVAVTDANTCTASTTAIVEAKPALAVSTSTTPTSCNGGADGRITTTISGGTTPYTYTWNTNATTKDLTALKAGTYTLTVTDAENCTFITEATISNASTINVVLTPTLPGCKGGTASINLQATGGTGTYTYSWSHGASTANVAGLTSGSYSVLVTDTNGCEATANITLDIPLPLAVYTTAFGPKCAGDLGSIDLTVEGGVGPFTYQWDFGSTSKNINNLSPATYAVTVTDANNCTATTSTIISPTPRLGVSSSTTEAGCGSKGGDVVVSIENGVAPFTYAWANGATTKDLINVPAGVYEGTVTDANGCAQLVVATVSSSANISGSIQTAIPPSCVNAQDGSITIDYQGGTDPIQFLWNTGATTANLTNIGAGNYSLTVTDAQNCQFVLDASLNDPETLVIAEKNQTSALCENPDGSLSIFVSGGNAPYNYTWSNGATTDRLENVISGSYTVTVTDSKGCTASNSFILDNDCTCPEPLYTAIMVNKANCGNSDGRIMIMVADHMERYTFDWPNVGAPGAAHNERINLPPGDYRVRITYARQESCSEIVTISLGNNEPEISTITNNTPAGCGQSNGQVTLAPAEALYQWADGLLGHHRTDLAAGTYQVLVTDVNGCNSTLEVIIRETGCNNCTISATATIDRMPSCDRETGAISIHVASGKLPYTYSWSAAPIGIQASATDLPIGNYTVTVSDADGCTAVASAELIKPTCTNEVCQIVLSTQAVHAKCWNEANGSIGVNVLDGKGPYQYTWSNGQQSSTITDLLAGTYSVTVVDAKGCTATATSIVESPTEINFTYQESFLNCEMANVNLQITGGTSPYKWLCNGLEGDANTPIILAPGSYTCTIMDNTWCSKEQTIVVHPITDASCTTQTTQTSTFKFKHFRVTNLDDQLVDLEWETENESTTGSFVIQHSTDNVTFDVIGTAIPADGPVDFGFYQQIVDLSHFGANYYQIKYVDSQGKNTLSGVQEVFKKLPREFGRAFIYPNPISDVFTVDFLLPLTEEKVMIVNNNLGRPIERITIPAGTIRYTIDASKYLPGIYTLIVDNTLGKDIMMRLVKVER